MNGPSDELIVYEHNESVCCQKLRLVLAEKGYSDYIVEEISFELGQQKSSEYLAINPKGVVPTIIHNGHTVTESTIIAEFLDEALPGPKLMPSDPFWRARRRLWARAIDDEMHLPHIATISFNIAFAKLLSAPHASKAKTLPARFSAGLESPEMLESLRAYQRFLNEMETCLSEHPWLAGPDFSLADIDVVPYIWRLHNLQLSGLWVDLPNVRDWLERVTKRPSFQAEIIATALPTWIAAMATNGLAAWPVIQKQLNSDVLSFG